MRGVAGRRKRHVGVIAQFEPNGSVRPLYVLWEGGIAYRVRDVIDVRPAPARKVGSHGKRYTVRIGSGTTYLFRDGDRWFVEEKIAEL